MFESLALKVAVLVRLCTLKMGAYIVICLNGTSFLSLHINIRANYIVVLNRLRFQLASQGPRWFWLPPFLPFFLRAGAVAGATKVTFTMELLICTPLGVNIVGGLPKIK